MKKFSKLIVTSMLAFAMLVGVSIPVKAAELQTMANDEINVADVQQRSGNLIAQYDCRRGVITQGMTLDPVTLTSRAKTIRFCVDGINGILNIRLTNQTTGDSRSFTAIGDGRWSELTYVTYMDTGTYSVRVEYADGMAHTRLRMQFYN